MIRRFALLLLCAVTTADIAIGQQIPFLSELDARYEQFNKLYSAKKRAGANLSAIEPLRKRGEEALIRGNIPALIELLGESTALLQGQPWDEKQRFISSLTLETNKLIITPNEEVVASVVRVFPADGEKAYGATPTVNFEVSVANDASSSLPRAVQPVPIAQQVPIAITTSNAARRLSLADGAYWVVARVEARGQVIAELKRPLYAISDFAGRVAQLSRTAAAIKTSPDPKVRAMSPLVATAEFKLEQVSALNRTREDFDLNPIVELDRIEAGLGAFAKGIDPLATERGELERAYRTSDDKLVPYRVYVPKGYDASAAVPLVVLLHGVLGDERYYFSGLFDPEVIKGEAERRGWILAAVNGLGRFSGYRGPAIDDTFEVIKCVTRDYRIDPSRVYLTGHSMGGFGTWSIASTKPELFAGIAAVSSGAPARTDALSALLAKLKGLAIMVVHGARDGIASPQLSRDAAAAARKAGLDVTYLEVPDADHLSTLARTFPAVLDFFDKHSKPRPVK